MLRLAAGMQNMYVSISFKAILEGLWQLTIGFSFSLHMWKRGQLRDKFSSHCWL